MDKGLLILTISILLVLAPPVNATITTLNATPEEPVRGDVVTVTGEADPDEEVQLDVSFHQEVDVQYGDYVFSLDNVKIPKEDNKFTVIAQGCDNLKITVYFFGLPITLGEEAENGTASISRSAPSGTYDISVHGSSSQKTVDLEIIATGYLKADQNGKFTYSYDTSPIPPGEFHISAGDITRTVILSKPQPAPTASPTSTVTPTPTPGPTPTPILSPNPASDGGSSGGGGGSGILTPTSAPTPTPTTTSSNVTGTPQPTKNTTSPQPSPTPSSPAEEPVNGTEEPGNESQTRESVNDSSTITVPGFGLLAVVIALFTILALRRI